MFEHSYWISAKHILKLAVTKTLHHNISSANYSQFMDKVVSQVLPNTLMPIFGGLPHSFGGRRWQWPSVGGCRQPIAPRTYGGRDRTADRWHARRRRWIDTERLVHLQQRQSVILNSCDCRRRCRQWRSGGGCGGCGCRSTVRRVLERRAHRTVRTHTVLPMPDDLSQQRTVRYWKQMHNLVISQLQQFRRCIVFCISSSMSLTGCWHGSTYGSKVHCEGARPSAAFWAGKN